MFFPGYVPAPFGKPDPVPDDVPLHIFKAAQRAGASHLSKDGKTIYMRRYGQVYSADWSDNGRGFGAWLPCENLPYDAVELP